MDSSDSVSDEHSKCFSVIYLTGAPASGKSSLCRELVAEFEQTAVFEYGAELTSYLNERYEAESKIAQSELREKSSRIATKEDIDRVDERLLKMVEQQRLKVNVIVDSHAVTKEYFGFRVTGFDTERIRQLKPTHIVCLYASPDVIQERISRDSGGRPAVSKQEADMHTQLQGSVAIGYGLATGAPVYFLDTSSKKDGIVDWFRSVFS